MRRNLGVVLLIFLFNYTLTAQRAGSQNKGASFLKQQKADISQQATGSIAWVQKPDFAKSNAFVENMGQCNGEVDGVSDKDILYRFDDDGMHVYFTATGVIYKIYKREKVSDKQWEKYVKKNGIKEARELDKDNEQHFIYKSSLMKMNWVNSNSFAGIEAKDITDFYFNYYRPDIDKNKIIGNVKGYKKLIYHNIYPGIDVEYIIAPENGIKYSYILHPGADASVIKMNYGNTKLKTGNGNILIPTALGDIIDHAPDTYSGGLTTNGQKIKSSFILADANTVGFKLANSNRVNVITVIDPWTTSPLAGMNNDFIGDIAVDANNNSDVNGCDPTAGTNDVVQYNAAGAKVWSLSISTKYGYGIYQGDITTDPTNNIYLTTGLGSPYYPASYNTIKLNSTGTTLLWGNTASITSKNKMYETWSLAFDCSNATLVQSGGGLGGTSSSDTYYNVSIFEPINSATGAEGAATKDFNYGEIIDSKIAGNGMLYNLSADTNINNDTALGTFPGSGKHNKLSCNNPGAGYAQVFEVNTDYAYVDGDIKEGSTAGGSIGYNGLGFSCNFLYTTDGKKLDQRSLTTGTLITTVNIAGGGNATGGGVSGGIVTDMCGNVYVGSNKKIYEYSPTLGLIGTVGGALPDYVYDIALGNNGQTIYACGGTQGTAFITAINIVPCQDVKIAVTAPGGCGAKASATATATFCSSTYTYSWSTAPVQTNATATNLSAGTYTVTVTGSPDCQFTYQDTAIVTIPASAGGGFTIDTATTPAACGASNGTASVTGTVGGTAPFTYSWSTAPVQTTSTATALLPGTYKVVVTSTGGCKDSINVTVHSSGATVTPIVTSSAVLCNGGATGTASVTSVGGNGSAPYTYSWSNAATSTTITALTAGVYTLTVKDNNGCVGTATDTVKQPVKLTMTAAAFAVTCNGLCNGSATAIPKGGTGPYSYLWNNSTSGTTANVNGLCAGNYSVVVTDANNCTVDTVGLVVTQPTKVTGTATQTSANCNQANGGACVTASGGTGAYTYSWNTVPAQTTTCINNVVAATYSVIIQDVNKCPDTVAIAVNNLSGDTAVITSTTNVSCNGGSNGVAVGGGKGGTAPYTYSWSTVPIQTTPTATGLKAGTYTLSVKDQTGCINTAVCTITQPTLVVATPGAPQTICSGQSATITASAAGGTAPYSYVWAPNGATTSSASVSPLTTTTYTVIASDSALCASAPVTVVVTVNPLLSVKVSPNQSICPGGSTSFTATASGGDGTYTYTWMPGGNTNATINVTPATTTVYTVIVKDGCGTPAVTDSVTATVNPLPVVNFKADTTQGCSPLCVTFTNLTPPLAAGFASWLWSYGDGGSSNAQNPSKYCYTNAGVYTVSLVAISNSGCSDSIIKPNLITVYSHPIAAFTASPQPATILNPTVTFTDHSTDTYGIASWLWQFNDPGNGGSTVANPVYTYPDTGLYCAKLTVTNIHGCTDSAVQCIEINPVFTFYIPNAFTPNHDGVNDVFQPYGTYICGFQMYIFDRWGQQLYSTSDINKGWNGRVGNGSKIAQEDTYVYLIDVTDCVQHKDQRYIGKVTLIK